MTKIVTSTVKHPQTPISQTASVAPTIAVRKSCNPEGMGLSHYVLMDKKAAK
ncbi:modified peptide precursor CbpA [Dechloromonas denitrificans]|uniref:modified peptide precursor CbpA n=1 Tax=Dechloromonas denitrificans TaxID=281362 RepID=UPI001CFC4224|nr:modified peptide precursor CbpA [Dechloromonas denitrificans]UCV08025.1 modified peptide precursor CbpA [Dechloromonas denitrificans]